MFKSLATLEKTVEKCRIEWKPEKSQLTFTLHCKHGKVCERRSGLIWICHTAYCCALTFSNLCSILGLLKTHNLSFQDCESLQAVFDKEHCPNVLRAQPRFGFNSYALIHIFPFVFLICAYLSCYLCMYPFLCPITLLDYLWTLFSISPPLWRK